MILSYNELIEIMPAMIGYLDRGKIKQPQFEKNKMVNPASIDICLGRFLKYERPWALPWHKRLLYRPEIEEPDDMRTWDLYEKNYLLRPHEFVLAETMEYITVPDGYAVDLRLKSTSARRGLDHALAFWVDPGWSGILTMEDTNNRHWSKVRLSYGMPFAQIIVHQLTSPAGEHKYAGRYQFASTVEGAKTL